MKAIYKKFKDGCLVFLESQDLTGGLMRIKGPIMEHHARDLVDELNYAFRKAEQEFADTLKEPK